MHAPDTAALLHTLKNRFDKHMQRHQGLGWTEVEARLAANPAALRSLVAMEETGGEPDVVKRDDDTGRFVFCDCSPETPSGRRSLCFDRAALDARKEHKPRTSAMEMAAEMGIEILDEAQYRALQELGEFDRKTSSWIATLPEVRKLGGALFCDRRYGRVFTYHNGAESYYAVRGFRGWIAV